MFYKSKTLLKKIKNNYKNNHKYQKTKITRMKQQGQWGTQ